MSPLVFTGLGIAFLLMGAALFALTLGKARQGAAPLSKAQLREQAALTQEMKKMRMASAVVATFGAVLVLLTFL